MRKFSIASAWYHGLEKHNAVDTYHFRQTSRLQLLQWNILGFGYCQLLLISGILLLDSGKLLLISGKLLLNCGKLLLNCGKFWPGQKTNNILCVFHSFSPVFYIITQFTHIKTYFEEKKSALACFFWPQLRLKHFTPAQGGLPPPTQLTNTNTKSWK